MHQECNNKHREVHIGIDNGVHVDVIEEKEK